MIVRFARVLDCQGSQLLLVRRLVPVPTCQCGRLDCQGFRLQLGVVCSTLDRDGNELLVSMAGADDTPAAVQQLLDTITPGDAKVVLEILQASGYEIDTPAETAARVEALRQSILQRVDATQ